MSILNGISHEKWSSVKIMGILVINRIKQKEKVKLEKWKGDSTVVINDDDFAIGCRVDVNPLDLQ